MTETKTTAFQRLVDSLDDEYELIYVDRDDKLTDDQVDMLVDGDWEVLWESTWEWESEARWCGWEYVVAELDQDDLEQLTDDELDELRYIVEDRDVSNPARQLAGQTGMVILRMPIPGMGEEDCEGRTPRDILAAAGLPETPENVALVQVAMDNACTDFPMAYIVASVDVGDVYDLGAREDAQVRITNPYIYVGNAYAGSGFVTEDPLEGDVTFRRDELRTDRRAFGYSVDDIYGGLYIEQSDLDGIA